MTQAHPDKLYDHHRQQLSAMLDGQLPPDEAKFMLRRLEHDGELAACWERWQVCGDILRGRHDALLPADFSARVVAAISLADGRSVPAAGAAQPTRRSRFARWTGGAAIAASVAIAALFVVRQPAPDAIDPVARDASPPAAALPTTLSQADIEPSRAAQAAPVQQHPSTPAPDTAAALASVAAIAAAPRRGSERTSRGQAQRAGMKLRLRDDAAPGFAVARATPSHAAVAEPAMIATAGAAPPAGTAYDPFAAQPVAATRPWPRAILPASASSGTFAAKFDGNGLAGNAFHPFEPRVETRAGDVRAPVDAAQPDATPTGPR